ncbi:MAG: hypothetical protein GAK40_00831 [Burkholderia plantarii]|nr:MAG: hypothetical protein GAK40_00831 [Burkholderia plantarii]
MSLHLQNADLVLIAAIALGCALVLAARVPTRSWPGLVIEALIANLIAIGAVVAVEVLLA